MGDMTCYSKKDRKSYRCCASFPSFYVTMRAVIADVATIQLCI